MSRILLKAVGPVIFLLVSPVLAAPTPQQIREAAGEFDAAVKALREGSYEEAAVHFEKAYREAPSPQALQGAMRARREAKQGARAATLAAQALARYPNRKDLSDAARATLSTYGKELARVEIQCSPSCIFVADQRVVADEPTGETVVYLEPGAHVVGAGWGTKQISRELEAKAGQSTVLTLQEPVDPTPAAVPSGATPVATPPVAESPPLLPAPSGWSPGVFWVGFTATAALGGVSAWSGIDTRSNPGPDVVRVRCAGKGAACPEYQDGLDRQRRTNVLLLSTAGVGVATAVVGLFLTNWSSSGPAPGKETARAAAHVVPDVGVAPGGAVLGAAGRF